MLALAATTVSTGRRKRALPSLSLSLADESLDGVRLMVVILYLGLNKDAVAGCVIPNMDAERRYAGLGCTDDRQGSEYAERLTAFTETGLRGATATNPRRGGLIGRVVNKDAQMVVAGNKGIGNIEGVAGPSHKACRG